MPKYPRKSHFQAQNESSRITRLYHAHYDTLTPLQRQRLNARLDQLETDPSYERRKSAWNYLADVLGMRPPHPPWAYGHDE